VEVEERSNKVPVVKPVEERAKASAVVTESKVKAVV